MSKTPPLERTPMRDERPFPWRYRAVAFDLDGLLIDTEPIFGEAIRRFLNRRGLTFEPDFMHTMMGSPAAQTLPLFREHFRLTDPLELIAAECKELFLAVLGDGPGPLMPGVAVLLDRLQKYDVPFCIATSSGSAFVRRVFGPHGMLERFRFVLTCEDVTHGKPHPEMYELAARRFDVSTAELVVLEDSPNGLRAAKSAGAKCIVVPHDHTPHDRLHGADLIVPSLDDERMHAALGLAER